jgi:hypothetical protein
MTTLAESDERSECEATFWQEVRLGDFDRLMLTELDGGRACVRKWAYRFKAGLRGQLIVKDGPGSVAPPWCDIYGCEDPPEVKPWEHEG